MQKIALVNEIRFCVRIMYSHAHEKIIWNCYSDKIVNIFWDFISSHNFTLFDSKLL